MDTTTAPPVIPDFTAAVLWRHPLADPLADLSAVAHLLRSHGCRKAVLRLGGFMALTVARSRAAKVRCADLMGVPETDWPSALSVDQLFGVLRPFLVFPDGRPDFDLSIDSAPTGHADVLYVADDGREGRVRLNVS